MLALRLLKKADKDLEGSSFSFEHILSQPIQLVVQALKDGTRRPSEYRAGAKKPIKIGQESL